MRLFLGPSDVLHAAESLTQGASRAAGDVVELFELVGRAGDLLTRAESLLDVADATLARADALLDASEATLARAAGAADTATEFSEVAATALPALRTVADSIEPDEALAVVRLVDRLPRLVAHLEDDVLPMLEQLDSVGPDVRAILESVQDLAHAASGLPGMGYLQRRGERKEDGS